MRIDTETPTLTLNEYVPVIEGNLSHTSILIRNAFSIPDEAFADTHLKGVDMDHHVEYIGDAAFSNTDITFAIIRENTIRVGDYAFAGCEKLEEVTIVRDELSPPLVIGNHCFDNCYALKKVTLVNKGESKIHMSDGSILNRGMATLIIK